MIPATHYTSSPFVYIYVYARAYTSITHTAPYNYYVHSLHLQCKRESISEWQFARYIIQSASAIRFVVSAAVITPTFQPSLRPLL